MTAKILILDIETSPNVADVWGLFNQNVSLNQLRESTRVICFAAKWFGDKKVMFASDHHDGHDTMIGRAWELVNEADVVVHYNGTRFDMPHLYREFLLAGAAPPAPVLEVDLLRVVRSRFRFTSNKLDHIATQLGVGSKAAHEGHGLWVKCLAGDDKAWRTMRRYNEQDVVITEQVYRRLRAWAPAHPHAGLFTDTASVDVCSRCGGADLQRRGFAFTAVSKYQRYRCNAPECGAWSRGKRLLDRVDARGI